MESEKNYTSLIEKIQEALREEQLDGWLMYNFRGTNIFASRILVLPSHIMSTRRYFYFIPSKGEPRKLVHRIEEWNLDSLPGHKLVYLSWRSLEDGLKQLLEGMKTIAMEYSPNCSIPYVATVDGGTLDLVRTTGVDIVSSANLIQYFEARWNDEQIADNVETAQHLREIVDETFAYIKRKLDSDIPISEYDVQQFMLSEFMRRSLVTSSDPNCSVNANSANPHYEPTKDCHSPINEGDFVLLDLWAKKDKPFSVYADITWTGFIGEKVPDEYEKIFQVVKGGRDAALECVRQAFRDSTDICGYEVDDAARKYITERGYGEYFIHRTGHSIGEEVHGNGANMDNLETRDERKLIPRTSFSIEPGIYFDGKFGVRSEIDVFISEKKDIIVTGLPMQECVVAILK